jgi:hypothetical protein
MKILWSGKTQKTRTSGLTLHGADELGTKAEGEQQEKSLDEITQRTATGDHKTHSRSEKNKTGNWNPVRAGRKSNDERTEKSETSFDHRGALLPKIELHGAATHASTKNKSKS